LPYYKKYLKKDVNKLDKTSICSFSLKQIPNNQNNHMGFYVFCKYLV